MITDPARKQDIERQWTVVQWLSRSSHRSSIVGGLGGGVYVTETPPEELYNLPLVLAYCVLEDVLDAMIAQRAFSCPSSKLAARMAASKGSIQWQDYALVDLGRAGRNALAHEGNLLTKKECLRFVNAIENELKGWSIL